MGRADVLAPPRDPKLTLKANAALQRYEKANPHPPLMLVMHTATLGALLAEWGCLDEEATLEGNYLLGKLLAVDDTLPLGWIQATR